MSFFRNIRSTITRSKSSSRDTTPVRHSRPGSIISNAKNGRRDSIESRTDSIFNRSDTFILGSDQEDKIASNTSTLEKKSKKSKVLNKFSTFTKRKKTPIADSGSYDHHPSDNATNTYYKWKSEGPLSLDYDSQTDPFNFLYEQQSSLKDLQNDSSSSDITNRTEIRNGGTSNVAFDSSTYRKGKMPTQLREQLEQLKTQTNAELHEEEEAEKANDKYKTTTLHSFRKSFRDKFLQQQKDAAHNPSWFVEVEQPAEKLTNSRYESKENRNDYLIFDNENYRPQSRSPVRERNERNSRSTARSPVKRNETFRVERPLIDPQLSSTHLNVLKETTPSIRIEIKNSIAPNMPGRIVPVGVAKPMPSHYTTEYYQHRSTAQQPVGHSGTTATTSLPLKNWSKPTTISPTRNASSVQNSGRYQTLVQIRNDGNAKVPQHPTTNSRGNLSTRIQLGETQRYSHGGTTHYPSTHVQHHKTSYNLTPLSSYDMVKNSKPLSATKAQRSMSSVQLFGKPKHTYFGDTSMSAQSPTMHARPFITSTTSRTVGVGAAPARANKLYQQQHHYQHQQHQQQQHQHQRQQQQQTRLPSSSSIGVGAAVGAGGGNYLNRRDQQQQIRVAIPTQRRSRSPIKMPWR